MVFQMAVHVVIEVPAIVGCVWVADKTDSVLFLRYYFGKELVCIFQNWIGWLLKIQFLFLFRGLVIRL